MKYLSPINVQIALMSIANTLITDIFILQLLIPPASSQVYTGLQMATDLSYYLFPFLVIYYTYCRAFPIIKSVANWSLFIFRGVIVVFGLLVLAQLTVAWLLDIVSESSELAPTAIIAYNLSNSIGTVIGEVLMTAFEVSSLALFIAYLRQSRRDGFTVNTARLTIVARFGIASFWCFQSYLASSIIINYILLAPEPQAVVFAICAASASTIDKVDQKAPRIVAGDFHGDLQQVRKVFRMAGLVDKALQWTGGPNTDFVQTGDAVDRGPDATALTNSSAVGDLRYVTSEDSASFGGVTARVYAWSTPGWIGAQLWERHSSHRVDGLNARVRDTMRGAQWRNAAFGGE
ncbi:hypothetical protein BC830DRAFT_1168580 [Chytriomyces sp. MP71]|nr:hypothetical protein BC830DRAFT_1168580 [Chytriomyces sp. MP71]